MKINRFKQYSCYIIVAIVFPLVGWAHAPSLEHQIERLIQKTIPHAIVGIMVQDPETGTILFQKNAAHYFYPASNTKILSSFAALKLLGPDFRFHTDLCFDTTRIDNGILNDAVSLIFQGDPTLTVNDLDALLNGLSAAGIRQIRGDFIIDDSAFEGPVYGPGWTWDSIPWYYSAPVASIIINENKVRLHVNPVDANASTIPIQLIQPSLPGVTLQANVRPVSWEEAEHRCRLNAIVNNNAITLTGCWPKERTNTTIELAIDHPRKIARAILLRALEKHGILLTGTVKFASAIHTSPIRSHTSAPLRQWLPRILADSNNIYSESLTKTMGRIHGHEGSFQAGVNAIQKELQQHTQQPFSTLPLSDGSGQSRYNLISPQLLTTLLRTIYHDPLFSIFYPALSINGKTGTLAERMKEKNQIAKIFAKTGSATGTSALSGYFIDSHQKMYIFSILINQADKKNYQLRALEDALCQLLLAHEWPPSLMF